MFLLKNNDVFIILNSSFIEECGKLNQEISQFTLLQKIQFVGIMIIFFENNLPYSQFSLLTVAFPNRILHQSTSIFNTGYLHFFSIDGVVHRVELL